MHIVDVTLKVALLLAALSLQGGSSIAQGIGNLAGRVLFTIGEVVALDENRATRELVRRGAIYAGDTIFVGPQDTVQIRMTDSALISLSCDAELKIEDYWYQESNQDIVTLRLLKGRFRTITGAVGETDRSRYRLLVGDSTVSIVGTDFEVIIDSDNTAYFAVYDGSIVINNSYGSLRLGIGADGDFAKVEPNQAPELLYQQPVLLGQTQIAQDPLAPVSSRCN